MKEKIGKFDCEKIVKICKHAETTEALHFYLISFEETTNAGNLSLEETTNAGNLPLISCLKALAISTQLQHPDQTFCPVLKAAPCFVNLLQSRAPLTMVQNTERR